MKRLLVPVAALVLLAGCASPRPGELVGGPGDQAAARPGDPSAVASPATPPASPQASPPTSPPGGSAPVCPRIELSGTDAAMGLRAMGIVLVNCGSEPYRLQGYPVVRALDEHRKTIVIDVLRDVGKIAGGIPGWDGSPPAVVLGPGERAEAVVVWRNTYDDITFPPVEVPYLRIAPLAGRKSQVVAPDHPLDLGSTGRIGVSHWRPDHPVGPGPARPPTATEATPPAPSDPPPLP